MANYIATTEELTAVADAIRAKGGISDALTFPDGFVTAIGSIQTGGGSSGGTGSGFPVVHEDTLLYTNSIYLDGRIARVNGSVGLQIYRKSTQAANTDMKFGTWKKWEIGVRFNPTETTKAVRALFGCGYNEQYYYTPSIELYPGGKIGIGYTHTQGSWSTWHNTQEPHVDFGVWNFLRYAYDQTAGKVVVTVVSDSGRSDTIEFAEDPFFYTSSYPEYNYTRFGFGQVAVNNNYASNVLFDLDNMYIIADGVIVAGSYAMNTDQSIT